MGVEDQKSKEGRDDTFDPHDPTPEEELPGPSTAAELEQAEQLEQPEHPPPVQKRKGGRKPIYATSEERKQRNRQAQAAFRERRTEYIKQLEVTIKQHEDNIQQLQQSNRTIQDECLWLRYRTSFLERVLLEKGINIQAELAAQGGAGISRPLSHAPPITQPQSAMQQAALNHEQGGSRHTTGLAPKLDVKRDAQQWRNSPTSPDDPGHPQSASHFALPSAQFDPASAHTQYSAGSSPRFSSFDMFHPNRQYGFEFPELEQPQFAGPSSFGHIRDSNEVEISHIHSYAGTDALEQHKDPPYDGHERHRSGGAQPPHFDTSSHDSAQQTLDREFTLHDEMGASGPNTLQPPFRDG